MEDFIRGFNHLCGGGGVVCFVLYHWKTENCK